MTPEQIRLLAHCLADVADIARGMHFSPTVDARADQLTDHAKALFNSTKDPEQEG